MGNRDVPGGEQEHASVEEYDIIGCCHAVVNESAVVIKAKPAFIAGFTMLCGGWRVFVAVMAVMDMIGRVARRELVLCQGCDCKEENADEPTAKVRHPPEKRIAGRKKCPIDSHKVHQRERNKKPGQHLVDVEGTRQSCLATEARGWLHFFHKRTCVSDVYSQGLNGYFALLTINGYDIVESIFHYRRVGL
jgi:hypothetical protein